MFNERLKKLRNDMHLKNKEMSAKLEVSESYYSLIESGKRNPSKTLIEKLVQMNKVPEEYWLYGMDKENNLSDSEEFENLKKVIEMILEFNIIDLDKLFDENNAPTDSLGKLLITALKKDINDIIKKK